LYEHASALAAAAESQLRACIQAAADANANHAAGIAGNGAAADACGACEGLALELAGVVALQAQVAGAKARARASIFLAAHGSGAEHDASRSRGGAPKVLLERLGEFNAGLVLLGTKGKHAKKGGTKKKGTAKQWAADGPEGAPLVGYRVASVPPALVPVACRPMLFNLAHNFVAFPNLDAKAGGPIAQDDDGAAAGGGGNAAAQAGVGGRLLGWLRG
jgi:hypothetical protein